ncbi:hypothetical protein FB446DRAFT_722805 [Lentinula raphanica]|nr:hypothetical protein FB446DRAFT_722805 [Lentinula raphanica]
MSPSPPEHITILYFAAASTTLGITSETIPIPPQTHPFYLSQLKDLLVERHTQLKGQSVGQTLRRILDTSQWSIDAEMVDDGDDEEKLGRIEVRNGMEVGVICPVSGG